MQPHSPARSHRVAKRVETNAAVHGLARTLSRLGVCSRSEAERRIAAGRVRLNGQCVRDPETPVDATRDRVELDGVVVRPPAHCCIAVNKPRGLVVTTADEQGRDTVYSLLRGANLPWLAPVGRLDKASEGLLLMSNDPAWAARITDPALHVSKTYRVQVRGVPDAGTLQRFGAGVLDRGERLQAESVRVVGGGGRKTWLEVVLATGRNRQIRRMCSACGHDVLRLIRIGIGSLELGELPKGAWRPLTAAEISSLVDGATGNSGL